MNESQRRVTYKKSSRRRRLSWISGFFGLIFHAINLLDWFLQISRKHFLVACRLSLRGTMRYNRDVHPRWSTQSLPAVWTLKIPCCSQRDLKLRV